MKLKVQIDGDKINSENDFHDVISKELDFPDYYGRNWDALWDCLSGHAETDVLITISCSSSMKNKLGKDFDKIVEIFERTHNLCPEFEYELK